MSYDFIVAGAGLSGLSFIHHLLRSNLRNSKVLVLDADAKKSNDRTWSFWTKELPSYQCAGKAWDRMSFVSDDLNRSDQLSEFRYYTIQGLDFYKEVLAEVSASDNIEFRQHLIVDIKQENDFVKVHTDAGVFECSNVIDSIYRPRLSTTENLVCWQNFLGWTIKTDMPVFEPSTPILMDFRTEQDAESANFVYVLPYEENRALVEYTAFTPMKEVREELFKARLDEYLEDHFSLKKFTIIDEEVGQIPMTDYSFSRKSGERIFHIGTAGGDTKPTTGYTFTNVQKACKSIIDGWGKNTTLEKSPVRFRFYDQLLLRIIQEKPQNVKPIMEFLFRNNPIDRVLKFLDEQTNLLEESYILGLLPWKPFIQALIHKNEYRS